MSHWEGGLGVSRPLIGNDDDVFHSLRLTCFLCLKTRLVPLSFLLLQPSPSSSIRLSIEHNRQRTFNSVSPVEIKVKGTGRHTILAQTHGIEGARRGSTVHDPVPSLDPVASRWASFQALPNAHQQLSASDARLVFHLMLTRWSMTCTVSMLRGMAKQVRCLPDLLSR